MSSEPLGRIVSLDKERRVFVGQRPGDDTTFYVGLRGPEGRITRLTLSVEALDALVWLRHHWNDGLLKEVFDTGAHTNKVWRLVKKPLLPETQHGG